MVTITLKGREIPLVLSTLEMQTIQEEICPIGEFLQMLFGRTPEDEETASRFMSAEHLRTVIRAVRILGNAGLDEAGKAPDLTDKWVGRALKPAQVNEAANACVKAFDIAMSSEIPPEKTEGPVDVTLEQMNKKKEQED